MSVPHPERRPAFFWQGALILLPVVVLAAVGLSALRADKTLAKRQAAERAQIVADSLLPKLMHSLMMTNDPVEFTYPAFKIDSTGNLLIPPGLASTEAPVLLDTSSLSAEQARLWRAAQAAEAAAQDFESAVRNFRDFIGSDPPARFAAIAQYSLGLLLAKKRDGDGAAKIFGALIEKYPRASAESGIPLEPLARLKTLEIKTASGQADNADILESVATVCSNAVWQPNQLSPSILDRARDCTTGLQAAHDVALRWQRTWEEHERSRELYAAWASTRAKATSAPNVRAVWFVTPQPLATTCPGWQPVGPGSATLSTGKRKPPVSAELPLPSAVRIEDQSWLAIRRSDGSNAWYVCRSESEISTRLTQSVGTATHIPEYFGVGIEVAGKRLTWPAPDLRIWENQFYSGRTGGKKKVFMRELTTEVLAAAEPERADLSGRDTSTEPNLLKLSIYLTSPKELFAREQARAFWFTALIGCGALAASVGFFAAYRAFHRQLRLSELKSNFVSSVSHELRAPIASVRLLAESLDRGTVSDPPRQQEYFKFIVQECRRLSSLIENVLDFSRIEQGRKQYEFEPTDLAALAQQTVKLMETYAAERQVKLEFQARPELVPNFELLVDGKAIQQALVNLIDNAIKHSPKDGTVTVGLSRRTGVPPVSENSQNSEITGTAALLWVEDHGEGIPASEHQKIFERFYRLGSELRRETQGVGIGLSIVKHITDAHAGRVVVRSEVGTGSRFTIELPIDNGTLAKSE